MPRLRHTRLAFQQGSSDKVYEVDLRDADGGFEVVARYGRRGRPLREDVKTPAPVSRDAADALFDTTVASKTRKGYVEATSGTPRPVDPDARRAAILARLDAAVEAPDADTDWSVDRVVWRAGELRIAEAAPAIQTLLATSSAFDADGAAMRTYCAVWALGRIGQPAADALDAVQALRDDHVQPAHVRRIAREAALHIATDAERQAALETLRAALPESVRQALDDRQPHALLGAVTPADLAPLDSLYTLALADEAAREVVLDAARAVPLAAPFALWIRSLYKTALFRDDAELFGLLAYRFATERSGFRDIDTSYEWSYDDGVNRTIGRRLVLNKTTGRVEYRRTTTTYGRGEWRTRTTTSETQVRTPDGPQWRDTEALSAREADATASLGYTSKTRAYFRRRAWRTLRRLGEAGDPAYVPMAVGALLAYSDDDAQPPRTVVYDWYDWETRSMRSRTTLYSAFAPYLLFNQVLYGNSPRYRYKTNNRAWSLREGVALDAPAPEAREEAFPELWDARPEGLLHLLAESRCAPVHAFAVRALRDHPDLLDRLGVEDVLLLLGRLYPETVGLGLDLARRLYDAAAPDLALVCALLDATLEDARALALAWIGDQPAVFLEDSATAAALLSHTHADVRAGIHALLADAALPGLHVDVLVGRCLATLMGSDATTDADRIRDIADALVALYPDALRRLSLGAIEDLVRHAVAAVQAVGGRLLVRHPTPPEALPGALIAALMTASSADVRAQGMVLFATLPDAHLLDQPEALEALALSPLADVREAVRPVLARLAAGHADFASAIAEALLPPLYRTERIDGLHADLAALLASDAFAAARAAFDRDRLWGLLHATPALAQALGARVLAECDWGETLTIRQITRLASHERRAVRQAAWARVEAQPERMRAHAVDALTLLDANWDDSRAFAFDVIDRLFDADVWTPDLLVHVVDSTRPDVQAFGRDLIARFFEDGDGSTYLLKLSEHPVADVQEFASTYLEAYASNRLDRIQALVPYFRAVLGQVNRARVAKDRVLAFLEREAQRSAEAARVIAPLLAHHSATIAVGDKATLIEAMRDLQDAHPDLDLPLERVSVPLAPVPLADEISDAV